MDRGPYTHALTSAKTSAKTTVGYWYDDYKLKTRKK